MKIEITVSTNKVGSDTKRIVEIDDDTFDDMDERERARTIDEFAFEAMLNMISWDWQEVE